MLVHRGTRMSASKGKIRSYPALLGLSLITLTVYYFYWLYINLREIRLAFPSDKDGSVVDAARLLFFIKVALLLVTGTAATAMILPAALHDPFHIQLPPALSAFKIVEFLSSVLFFYFFCRSVAFAKTRARIQPAGMRAAFGLYAASAVFDAVTTVYFLRSNFLESMTSVDSLSSLFDSMSVGWFPLMSQLDFVGSILWLVAIYLVQRDINRVWKDGSLEAVSYNAFEESSRSEIEE